MLADGQHLGDEDDGERRPPHPNGPSTSWPAIERVPEQHGDRRLQPPLREVEGELDAARAAGAGRARAARPTSRTATRVSGSRKNRPDHERDLVERARSSSSLPTRTWTHRSARRATKAASSAGHGSGDVERRARRQLPDPVPGQRCGRRWPGRGPATRRGHVRGRVMTRRVLRRSRRSRSRPRRSSSRRSRLRRSSVCRSSSCRSSSGRSRRRRSSSRPVQASPFQLCRSRPRRSTSSPHQQSPVQSDPFQAAAGPGRAGGAERRPSVAGSHGEAEDVLLAGQLDVAVDDVRAAAGAPRGCRARWSAARSARADGAAARDAAVQVDQPGALAGRVRLGQRRRPSTSAARFTWSGVRPGRCCSSSAAAPETTAAACEVPLPLK